MGGKPDPLDELIRSVADGASIDWERVANASASTDLRQLIEHLRVVAGVASLHRSQVDDVPLGGGPVLEAPAPASSAGHDRQRPSSFELDTTRSVGEPRAARWGHLLLFRKIGEGAFGEVYHAHDTWLDHPVALKLLKPETGSADRILHEARTLARVRHPNVVTVHGADRHDGRVGFWMDFVEGETLAARVAKGRLSAGEATHIGVELCRALSAVHQAKLVHRDVKAQNVMRASDGGRIILMDFGAGEFLDRPSAGSRAVGTPLYLAPEIFREAPASVRTDVYSTGVLLYHLVTGTYPVVAGSLLELAAAHARGERTRLWDARPDLPDSFVAIVERALDPDPSRRFQSAGEMLAALAHESAGGSQAAPVPGIGGRRRIDPDAAERPAAEQIGRVLLLALGLVALTGAIGLIASRVFELVLRIDEEFAAGPSDVFAVGLQTLFPFAIYWLAGAAVLAVLAGMRPLVRGRFGMWWNGRSGGSWSLDPAAQAMLVVLSGAAIWAALSWVYFDVFAALDRLRVAPAETPVDVTALSPSAHEAHTSYGGYSAFLSFAMALLAWRWFPQLERRAEDTSTVRLLRWAAAGVAFVAIASAAAPRRLIWETFEVVAFGNQRALVIASNADELLLYAPDLAGRPRWRVQRDAPELQRTGATRKLFETGQGQD